MKHLTKKRCGIFRRIGKQRAYAALLAKQINMTYTQMCSIIDELKADGLIKVHSGNQNKQFIAFTSEGEKLAEHVEAVGKYLK